MSGYYLLENGEFAYNKSTSGDSPWGAIKRLTKYEKGCLSTLYICFGLDLGDPDFLVTYYETNRWHGAVQMIAAEGARNHGLLNIAPDDFFETVLTLPCSTEEQKQIGCFFTQLNSLITLHQRKCEYRSLCGYLSWEQRKLGEVADRYDNLRIPITASERVPGSTPYYGANGIQDYVEGFTHQGEFVLIAEDGASDLDNYPTMCINGIIWVNNHAHVIQGRKDITDNHFIAWSIKRCDIKPMLTGGTRAKLNAEVLMGMRISTPNHAEQISIGSFFEHLDSLITLHQ